MLKIKDFTFQEDWGDRRSCLMFFKADREESASWAVDIGFKPGDFEDSGSGIYIVTSATFEKKKEVRNSFWIFQLSGCAFQGISSWYSFSSIRGEV